MDSNDGIFDVSPENEHVSVQKQVQLRKQQEGFSRWVMRSHSLG